MEKINKTEFPIEAKPSEYPLYKTVVGFLFIVSSLLLFLAYTSHLFNWQADQSQLDDLLDKEILAENILGKVGAQIGHASINNGIGIMAFILPVVLFLLGLTFFTAKSKIWLRKVFSRGIFFVVWLPMTLALLTKSVLYYGVFGFEVTDFLTSLIGRLGIGLLLATSLIVLAVFFFKITPDKINQVKNKFKKESDDLLEEQDDLRIIESQKELDDFQTTQSEEKEPIELEALNLASAETEEELVESISLNLKESASPVKAVNSEEESVALTVEESKEEAVVTKSKSEQMVDAYGEYDPTLELSTFKFPPLSLLKDYNKDKSIAVDTEELEANKNKIVETLSNYKIGISGIKAIIGPTVTLYEIIPEAGVRISKIKNLEDDIALSLAALGIRIIAPIPGKGTIGIEVPNASPSIVSMRSVIASKKFQEADMELPIAFGKTISNETFVADLAKMPHMLMAGATGQGKSVGLNAMITSLLYKKHPSELKFVLVDPKKVELTLYNKIERHYLAKIPESDEAIITDNTKVINTLNSLCIEMDQRYELLKNAMVRNIKEYNVKFKARKLNPENGHRFLPYIVLVVDEFADLIMTAGKEVETPIARLAQLARAIGIHLIVATQRPSVNVITGIIKANFPARSAFRVTSKIDSRTILDASGADQLIGKGDMLITTGNELIRVQCAFIDTEEVEAVTEFIGSQKGYTEAYILPEYVNEDSKSLLGVDLDDRDVLFNDAARLVVMAQQGSASLLQRKLKLGYNRAGRIIDQLEAAGIVGQFEGSKARQVLVQDDASLEQLLTNKE